MAIRELVLLLKARDEASRVLAETGLAAERAGGGISSMLKAAAGGAALSTMAGFMSDIAREGAKDVAAMEAVRVATENSGAAWDDAEGQISLYIDRMRDTAAIADDKMKPALASLIAVTGDHQKAMDLASLSADIARGRNVDLASTTVLVGKVAMGNVGALKRFGITLEEGATATEALAALQAKFAGQSEAYAQTTQGQMEALSNRIGDFRESLGSALGPMQAVFAMMPGMSAAWTAMGGIIGGITPKLIAQTVATIAHTVVSSAQSAATSVMTAAQWLLNAALSANPIGIVVLAVAALTAAIVYLWNNSKEFQEFLAGLWDNIQAATIGVLAAFQQALTAVGEIMGALGGTIGAILQGGLDALTEIALAWIDLFLAPYRVVWETLDGLTGGALTNLWNAVSGGLQDLIDLAARWIDRFVKPFRDAWNSISGMFDWVIGKSALPDMVQRGLNEMTDMAWDWSRDFTVPFRSAFEDIGQAVNAGMQAMSGIGWPAKPVAPVIPKLTADEVTDLIFSKDPNLQKMAKESGRTGREMVGEWWSWGPTVREGANTLEEYAAKKGWLPKAGPTPRAAPGPRISPSGQALRAAYEEIRPWATTMEEAATSAVERMKNKVIALSGGKVLPSVEDMQGWWNSLIADVLNDALNMLPDRRTAPARITAPSIPAASRPAISAAAAAQNVTINLSGTFLASDRSMLQELARLLKPELDNLVRLGV